MLNIPSAGGWTVRTAARLYSTQNGWSTVFTHGQLDRNPATQMVRQLAFWQSGQAAAKPAIILLPDGDGLARPQRVVLQPEFAAADPFVIASAKPTG
ncbi:MAG: hypothetical protein ACJ8AI_17885 [Rhodopila sp.]